MVGSSASSSSRMIGLAAAVLTSAVVSGFVHPNNYCHRTTIVNGNIGEMTRVVYMSLTDDGGLSSSSFGNSGSSSGSTSSGGNVESSSNSSGDETVRHYTHASFGNNESEQQQQYNTRHSQHEEEEDVVSRRFSNAALGGEFDINNLSERTTRIISDVRRARWAREAVAKMKFSTGDELHELRSRIAGLRNELLDIKLSLSSNGPGLSDTTIGRTESTTDTNNDRHRKKANEIENEIAILNDRDAEFVYVMSSELKKRAVLNGDTEGINEYQCKMEDAMSCIPQMNLHGLWVGK
jgi:hypothetical protein